MRIYNLMAEVSELNKTEYANPREGRLTLTSTERASGSRDPLNGMAKCPHVHQNNKK